MTSSTPGRLSRWTRGTVIAFAGLLIAAAIYVVQLQKHAYDAQAGWLETKKRELEDNVAKLHLAKEELEKTLDKLRSDLSTLRTEKDETAASLQKKEAKLLEATKLLQSRSEDIRFLMNEVRKVNGKQKKYTREHLRRRGVVLEVFRRVLGE